MPLPGRTNIVVTRSAEFAPAGVVVARTPDEALQLAEARDAEESFIAGGSEIFRLMLPIADRMYVTRIEADFDGDTFFPEVDWRQWELVSSEEHQPDEKNRWAYSFLVYDRKK
jgi:dihydrofolate reductase